MENTIKTIQYHMGIASIYDDLTKGLYLIGTGYFLDESLEALKPLNRKMDKVEKKCLQETEGTQLHKDLLAEYKQLLINYCGKLEKCYCCAESMLKADPADYSKSLGVRDYHLAEAKKLMLEEARQ